MVVSADGLRVYVANTNADSVSVINTATNKVVATVKVGDQPRALAVSTAPGETVRRGGRLWR